MNRREREIGPEFVIAAITQLRGLGWVFSQRPLPFFVKNPVQLVRRVVLWRCGAGGSRWISLKCGCCATDDRGNEYTGKADSGCSTGWHQGHLSKRLCVTARNLKLISGNSDGSRGFAGPEEAQLSQIPAFPSSSQPDSRTTNPGRTVMFITTVFSGEIDFADTKVRGLIHLRSTACVICEG